MPRRYEIENAFRNAVRKEANGRITVTTVDFVEKLAAVNWHWSLKEANNWIEYYITTFKDISDQEGEERTFTLYNPNRGGY